MRESMNKYIISSLHSIPLTFFVEEAVGLSVGRFVFLLVAGFLVVGALVGCSIISDFDA